MYPQANSLNIIVTMNALSKYTCMSLTYLQHHTHHNIVHCPDQICFPTQSSHR